MRRRAGAVAAFATLIAAAAVTGSHASIVATSTASRTAKAAGRCQHGPPPPLAGPSTLNGVGVLSACDAWAVGSQYQGSRSQIDHWNGQRWTRARTPGLTGRGGAITTLQAVAAISETDVWAVGNVAKDSTLRTVAEHWNGGSWTLVPILGPAGQPEPGSLNAAAAVSASDVWAVGKASVPLSHDVTLIEQWNGSSWQQLPSPDPGTNVDDQLNAVVAKSASSAWAGGQECPATGYCSIVLQRWNGATWSDAGVPKLPRVVYSIIAAMSTVPRSKAVWAVGDEISGHHPFLSGDNERSLILRWNGRSWKRVPASAPRSVPSFLLGVDAFSATDAVAVGYIQKIKTGLEYPLIEHWNGQKWSSSILTEPLKSDPHDVISAVAGRSCSDAWFVGSDFNPPLGIGQGFYLPLAIHC